MLTLETRGFFPFLGDFGVKAICHLCECSLCYWCQLTEEVGKQRWGMFSNVLTSAACFPLEKRRLLCNRLMFSRLRVFLGDFTVGDLLLFRAPGVISAIHYFLDARCWENCLLIEHCFCSSPLFEACSSIPLPALNCGGDTEKFHSCPVWYLAPPSAFLLSHCNVEVARELGLSLPWIYTSKGGSCIKYLGSYLQHYSLFAFY